MYHTNIYKLEAHVLFSWWKQVTSSTSQGAHHAGQGPMAFLVTGEGHVSSAILQQLGEEPVSPAAGRWQVLFEAQKMEKWNFVEAKIQLNHLECWRHGTFETFWAQRPTSSTISFKKQNQNSIRLSNWFNISAPGRGRPF